MTRHTIEDFGGIRRHAESVKASATDSKWERHITSLSTSCNCMKSIPAPGTARGALCRCICGACHNGDVSPRLNLAPSAGGPSEAGPNCKWQSSPSSGAPIFLYSMFNVYLPNTRISGSHTLTPTLNCLVFPYLFFLAILLSSHHLRAFTPIVSRIVAKSCRSEQNPL